MTFTVRIMQTNGWLKEKTVRAATKQEAIDRVQIKPGEYITGAAEKPRR